MCGIGGCVLKPNAAIPGERLEAMRAAMCHRGPDDSGIEVHGNVALVQTRLSIVELTELGHQPMVHPSGDLVLAYNGEIYNHASLRRELPNASFRGTSDTETLLWSLATWGLAALPRLSGQFAFIAHDRRQEKVILCRDRFGIKPLYIARAADGIWFASEPEALLAAGIEASPVDGAWDRILSGSYLGGTTTLLEGITRLDAGSTATISVADASMAVARWDSPADAIDPELSARLSRMRRSQATDLLESTLRSSVHQSLLADATVGTLCSGGLDSSLITAFACEAKPDMVAFAASFKGDGKLDEGLAARRVADALGIPLELVDVTPERWLSGFVGATVHHGGPLANASPVTIWEMAARARAAGVKVLMTGEGADELFGGYDNQHAAQLESFLPPLQRLIRRLEPKLLGDPKRFLDPRAAARKLIRGVERLSGRRSAASGWSDSLNAGTSVPTFEEAMAAYAHHGGQRQQLEARLLSRLEYSLCWLLNRMDKNMMQTSVEARVPFLEPAVASLVLNLPLEYRVGPWSKGILRDVGRRLLPLSIAHRPKIYGMSFHAGLWVEEAADARFLDQGMLRELISIPSGAFEAARQSPDTSLKLRLWSAEVWCRSALAGQTISEIESALWR